ncbi:MAG: methyltransferase domain-containing protein [Deltaproteobacteria bacterium]
MLAFLKHDWSGTVELQSPGTAATNIDLYDPTMFQNFLWPLPLGARSVRLAARGGRNSTSAGAEVWLRGAMVSDEPRFDNYFPKLLVNDEGMNGTGKWEEFWSDAPAPGEGCGGWPYRLPYLEAFRQVMDETECRSVLELGAQSGRWISYLARYLDADLSPRDLVRAHRNWNDGGFLLLDQASRPSPRYEFAIADCAGSAIRAATGRMPWVRGHHVPDFGRGLTGIPDKSADVVFSFHTVEHVIEVETLLREMLRVGRKYLICSTPFEENPHLLHPVRLDQHRLVRFFVDGCGLDRSQISFTKDYSSANIRKVAPNSLFWCVRLDPALPDPWDRLLSPRIVPGLISQLALTSGRVVGRRLVRRV